MSYATITEDIKEKLSKSKEDPALFSQYLREIKTFDELYYLHPARTNVLRFYTFENPSRLLEIGTDGGVYTEYLAGIFQSVLCLDADEASASLAKIRCDAFENVEIRAGGLSESMPGSETGDLSVPPEGGAATYDYVLLHKALLEPALYLDAEEPHEALLNAAKAFLKPGGKLLLLAENRLGMRYWAGAKTRENGKYFAGLSKYELGETKKSFSKHELTALLSGAGFRDLRFYYPYPDEYFAKCVYSDDYLPKPGELAENILNFDEDRLILFDEAPVFDTIVKEGSFPEFSNAFLIEAARED